MNRRPGCQLSLLLLGPLLFLSGCRSNKDLLETEIRSREIQNRELLDDLERAEIRNQALERELNSLRQGWKLSPEKATQVSTVQRIVLGRLTGGHDIDGNYGDDALQVIVEPRDADDHVLQAPGELHVLALEINGQGLKTPIGSWDISPVELRRSWKSGLLSTGYTLTLPWKVWPTSENLRITVRLILPDGRAFETDKDIKIRISPGSRPTHGWPVGPDLHGPDPLPPPRPFPESDSMSGKSSLPPVEWRAEPLNRAVRLERPLPQD
jgi:hypothetical protein